MEDLVSSGHTDPMARHSCARQDSWRTTPLLIRRHCWRHRSSPGVLVDPSHHLLTTPTVLSIPTSLSSSSSSSNRSSKPDVEVSFPLCCGCSAFCVSSDEGSVPEGLVSLSGASLKGASGRSASSACEDGGDTECGILMIRYLWSNVLLEVKSKQN